MRDALKPLTENAKKSNEEAKELASQLNFKVTEMLTFCYLLCSLLTLQYHIWRQQPRSIIINTAITYKNLVVTTTN